MVSRQDSSNVIVPWQVAFIDKVQRIKREIRLSWNAFIKHPQSDFKMYSRKYKQM